MTVWSDQADALFGNGDIAIDGLYKVGGSGAGTTFPVVPVRRSMDASLFGQAVQADRMRIDIRASDVAAPARGDTVTIGSKVWTVGTPPTADAYGLVWTLECHAGAA